MNTKGMKFLAVLAVLAMAFAAFAVAAPAETDDATGESTVSGVTVIDAVTTAEADGKYYVKTSITETQTLTAVAYEDPKAPAHTHNFYLPAGNSVKVGIGAGLVTHVTVYAVDTLETPSGTVTVTLTGSVQKSWLDSASTIIFKNVGGTIYYADITGLADTTNYLGDANIIAADIFNNKTQNLYDGVTVNVAEDDSNAGISTIFKVGDTSVTVTNFNGSVKNNGGEFQILMNKPTSGSTTITVPSGSTFKGTVAYTHVVAAETVTDSVDVKLKAGTSGLTFKTGSIDISGDIAALEGSKILQSAGEVKLGAGTGGLEVESGTVTLDGAFVVGGNGVAIDNGATVKTAIGSSLTATAGNINVAASGKLDVAGGITGNVANEGTVVLETGADVSAATINGTIKDNTSSSTMSELIVKGDSENLVGEPYTFPAVQSIVVNEYWNLVKNTSVTIKGELIIPEGTKMTIEAGASLTLDNNAKIYVYGTLVIEEQDGAIAAGHVNIKYGHMYVYGTLNVKGALDTNNDAASATQYGEIAIKEGATVTIASTGSLVVNDTLGFSQFNVETGAVLTVKGAFDFDQIYNYGTVIIDSSKKADASSTIHMMSSGAVVEVKKFVGSAADNCTLTITDAGLVVYNDKSTSTKYVIGTDDLEDYVNSVTIAAVPTGTDYIATIGGLTFTENVISYGDRSGNFYIAAAEKSYTNTLYMYGDVTLTSSYDGTGVAGDNSYTGTITNNGYNVVVPAEASLELAKKITLVNSAEKTLTVKGTVDTTAYMDSSDKATFTNNGTITVTGNGKILSNNLIAVGDGINATKIESDTATYTLYEYVTVDTALAMVALDDSITDLLVMGSQTVGASAVLPDEVTMTLASGATLGIGSSYNRDVVLTVEDDALLKGAGTINVNGTLYAENFSVVKGNTINSDIFEQQTDDKGKVVKTGWARWTNIVTALNGAGPGDVITISRTNTNVTISGNAEIKEGVRLVVPEDVQSIKLGDGVTLTVNGILETEVDILAEHKFALKAANITGNQSSAIVVNGAIILPTTFTGTYKVGDGESFKTNGAPIAGAYYAMEDNLVISSIEVALYNIEDITSAITINGNVKAGDLEFEATDYCDEIIVGEGLAGIPTSFTVNSIELDGSKIRTLNANGDAIVPTFTGVVKVGTASVDIKGATAASSSTTVFSIADSNGKLILGGVFDISAKGSVLTVSAGDVYVASGFKVTADSDNSTKMVVSEGATLIAAADAAQDVYTNLLTVDGTLKVPTGTHFKVETLTVNGSIVVEPSTSTKAQGSLTVLNMYVGMAASSKITPVAASASASVSGPIAFASVGGTAYGVVRVLAGSTIADDTQAILDAIGKKMVFNVGGSEWFSAYPVGTTTTLKVATAPIEDSLLLGWATKAGVGPSGTYTPKATAIAFADGTNNLYAVIDVEIYKVTIITDTGIKSVAIDGIEMIRDGSSNLFITGLYDNEGNLTLGRELVAGTHTVSYTLYNGYEGTAQLYTADNTILKDLKFTLSGTDNLDSSFQLKGTEQIVTPEPSPVEQNEWTITTILLVILVILIAIMAVIVALRLNRS